MAKAWLNRSLPLEKAPLDTLPPRIHALATAATASHAAAHATLETGRAHLTLALNATPARALDLATAIDALAARLADHDTSNTSNTSNTRDHDTRDQDEALAALHTLCALRARIEAARLAVADAQRWASLAQTLHALPVAEAATQYAAARADLDTLRAYLPPAELERRDAVLADARAHLWTSLRGDLVTALAADASHSSTWSLGSEADERGPAAHAGDVAAVLGVARRIGADADAVAAYCDQRASALATAASRHGGQADSQAALVALVETLEADHVRLPLLPDDRATMLLALARHALRAIPLSDDPTHDPPLVARMERVLAFPSSSSSSSATAKDVEAAHRRHAQAVQDALAPLLARIAGAPTRANRLASAALATLFDRVPLTSTDPGAIAGALASVLPTALAVPGKLVAQHRALCGGLRARSALAPVLGAVAALLASRVARVLRRVHYLDTRARLPRADTDVLAPAGIALANAARPEALARYAAGVGAAVAVVERVRAAAADLAALVGTKDAAAHVPAVVVRYLADLDADDDDDRGVVVDNDWAMSISEGTETLVATSLDYFFEYVFAPVAGTLQHEIIGPAIALQAPTTSNTTSNGPPPRSSTPGAGGLPPSTPTARASGVTALPQFSKSPSTAAIALGEYLLQLPHHVESIAAQIALGPGAVAAAGAYGFAETAATVVGKLVRSAAGGVEEGATNPLPTADVLEAVAVATQAAVMRLVVGYPAPSLQHQQQLQQQQQQHQSAQPPSAAQSIMAGFRRPGTPSTPDASGSATSRIAASASTGRLASLVSSTLGNLPQSLSMRAGLAELGGASASPGSPSKPTSASAGDIRASAASVPSPSSATAFMPGSPGGNPAMPSLAATAPVIPAAARDQLALDLAYLANVLTAIDCPARAEYAWLVSMVVGSEDTAGPAVARASVAAALIDDVRHVVVDSSSSTDGMPARPDGKLRELAADLLLVATSGPGSKRSGQQHQAKGSISGLAREAAELDAGTVGVWWSAWSGRVVVLFPSGSKAVVASKQ
ncbi:hypothetical protein BC828DRAFT_393604 [Blastocladiella britannica]|nr:hypothetical protein BC828DRAFT_393604 [Blastocladiella britannica]